MQRIFLVKEPSDCEQINKLCEMLDKTHEDYDINYDDEVSDTNSFGIIVEVTW